MTSSTVATRLEAAGITLPPPVTPLGIYSTVAEFGNCVWTATHGPLVDGEARYRGIIGDTCSVEDAQAAARLTGLNILSSLQAHLGSLERVRKIVRLTGYVRTVADFESHPKILDPLSELLVTVLGDDVGGGHARGVVGVATMTRQLPVSAELVAVVAD